MSAETIILLTPEFRLSFPSLLEPRQFKDKDNKPKGKPNYSLEMLFDPESMKSFKQFLPDEADGSNLVETSMAKAAMAAAKAEWPKLSSEDLQAMVKGKEITWPIIDGDAHVKRQVTLKGKDEEKLSHYKGVKLVKAKTVEDYPPALYKLGEGNKLISISRDTVDGKAEIKKLFAGGNYCYAELTVKAGMSGDNMYVTCYLSGVTFIRRGEPIGSGGGGGAMSRFQGIVGGQSDYDPTGGDSEDAGEPEDWE